MALHLTMTPRSGRVAAAPAVGAGRPAAGVVPRPFLRAAVVCRAAAEDPPKDDKDKADTPAPASEEGSKSRAAEKRAKFLANVKIPDESAATTRKIAKERN